MSAPVKPRIRVKAGGKWSRRVITQGSSVPGFGISASYDAAGTGKRAEGWKRTPAAGPVKALSRTLDTIRRRVRHELRNNPAAAPVIDIIDGNVIGGGINPIIRDEALRKLWERWSEQCDADGIAGSFGELQSLAMLEIVGGGEVFGRLRPRDPKLDPWLAVPLQVQLLPGEMVPSRDTSGESVAGIVYSGPGRKSAIKFRRRHPDEEAEPGQIGARDEFSIVPATDCLHAFSPRAVGQVRGEPWLVRSLPSLHDLDAFLDAELVRKKLAAMLVFSIETPGRDETQDAPESYDEAGNPLDADGNLWVPQDPTELLPELRPGAVVPMSPGYELKTTNPAQVGGDFEPFVRAQMRRICAAIGVPYCLASGDMTGISDRVLRVQLMEFRRLVRKWRGMLVSKLCRPVWRRFVDDAVLSGAWSPPAGTTVEDWYGVEWIGEPMGHLHPLQEVQAIILAMKAGLKPPQVAIREWGGDPDQVLEMFAQWNAAVDERGLAFVSDGRRESQPLVVEAEADDEEGGS